MMAAMLYGTGMRPMEVVRLRVKDVDFGYRQIQVRNAKRNKDRVTPLPERLIKPLPRHPEKTKALHEQERVPSGRKDMQFKPDRA